MNSQMNKQAVKEKLKDVFGRSKDPIKSIGRYVQHTKAKREKDRQLEFNKIEDEDYTPTSEQSQKIQDAADQLAQRENERNKPVREQQKKEAMEEINTPTKGLDPVLRQSMQEMANKQIGGQIQNYHKMQAGYQGSRGVRGSKAQAGINREALNAQTQVQRDLNLQEGDLSMQRLAAYLSSLRGKESDEILKNQKYWDYITGQQDKRRAGAQAKFYNKYYGTV